MNGTHIAKKIVTHPYFGMICVLAVWFILPRYGGIAMMVGNASLLSVYALILPELFHSRSGSMMATICLVATMWVGAAVVTVMTLTREFGT